MFVAIIVSRCRFLQFHCRCGCRSPCCCCCCCRPHYHHPSHNVSDTHALRESRWCCVLAPYTGSVHIYIDTTKSNSYWFPFMTQMPLAQTQAHNGCSSIRKMFDIRRNMIEYKILADISSLFVVGVVPMPSSNFGCSPAFACVVIRWVLLAFIGRSQKSFFVWPHQEWRAEKFEDK